MTAERIMRLQEVVCEAEAPSRVVVSHRRIVLQSGSPNVGMVIRGDRMVKRDILLNMEHTELRNSGA